MNPSIPGAAPPPEPCRPLLEVLRELLRHNAIRNRERQILRLVIDYFDTPELDRAIDRRVVADLRGIAERPILWEHKVHVSAAADHIEKHGA